MDNVNFLVVVEANVILYLKQSIGITICGYTIAAAQPLFIS